MHAPQQTDVEALPVNDHTVDVKEQSHLPNDTDIS
jgi:hypothetical protein